MPQQKRSSSSASQKSKRTKINAESAGLVEPKDNKLAKAGLGDLLAADRFMKRLEKLESVQEQIEKDRDSLRTAFKSFKKQNDALKAAEQEIAKLKKELTAKEEKIKNLINVKHEIEYSNEASKLKALGFEKQVADKEKSNIALEKRISELNADIKSKDKLIADLKEQKGALQDTTESKDKLIIGLQRQVEALNASIKSKEKSLKELQNKQENLNKQISAGVSKNHVLMKKESVLQGELAKLSMTNKALAQEIGDLKQLNYRWVQWSEQTSQGWNAYKIDMQQKNDYLENAVAEKNREIILLKEMLEKAREPSRPSQSDNLVLPSQSPPLGFSPYFADFPELQDITLSVPTNDTSVQFIAQQNIFYKPGHSV